MKFPYFTGCDDCKYYTMMFPGEEGCTKNRKMDAWVCFVGKNKKESPKESSPIIQNNIHGDNNLNL